MRRRIVVIVIVVAAAGAGLWWWLAHRPTNSNELVLYGNIDLRQVQLAFNNSERIKTVMVQEGDRVAPGQLVAELDTDRLKPPVEQAKAQAAAQRAVVERMHHGNRPEEIAEARAQAAAQRAVVERMHNGSRPEEIAQARANLASARADAANARIRYERDKNLMAVRLKNQGDVAAVSQEELDNAKAALDVAEAKVMVNQQALDLALLGPRKEDVAQAEAQLRQLEQALKLAELGPRHEDVAQAEAQLRMNDSQLKLLEQQLADAELRAPASVSAPPEGRHPASQHPRTYTVRTRLLEPGEMSSPQKPVFTLAVTDPKWVRAYVTEVDLGKVKMGMTASVAVDSFPGRRFDGWVGFISPIAEFTPKTVQTEELRTSLVYEVRVFVKDPQDELHLGMPATVYLSLAAPAAEGK